MKILTKTFSFLLHPLLMPTIGILILMYSNSYIAFIPESAKKMIIILTAVGTFLLPALMIPIFMLRGMVTEIQMDDRRERLFPLAITLIFYILTFVLFIRIPVYRLIHAFMLGTLLSLLAGFLITFKWKISTHMIGLGGLTAFILIVSLHLNIYMLPHLILVILASGIAGASRLYLNAHNATQVCVGFITGFVVMAGSLVGY